MEKVKMILAILLILTNWYLVFSLLEIQFNPLEWSLDGRLYFVWLSLGTILCYGIYKFVD